MANDEKFHFDPCCADGGWPLNNNPERNRLNPLSKAAQQYFEPFEKDITSHPSIIRMKLYRYEEVETMVVPLKESEQEVAFENLDSLTHVQKFYYGQCTFIIQRTEFIEKLLIEKSLRTSFDFIKSELKTQNFTEISDTLKFKEFFIKHPKSPLIDLALSETFIMDSMHRRHHDDTLTTQKLMNFLKY
ncbi:hypothetical protein HZH66_012896 [Vespula vulgaris]|uniref:Uncharacterized protein n=1 Tax=Vespula vulgaris TaxID=7454 RepID=A0A834J9L5_VESVU|nr:hypothetical protein HZH66_012896 [Vespula vulgaris]